MKNALTLSAISLASLAFPTLADSISAASDHAPIGVMGDHLHKKGEWMTSYRYMTMEMSDLQQGSSSISSEDALTQYMMVPKDMDMKMHMIGLMYAPSDDITLMVMANYIDNDMNSLMRNMNMSSDMSGMSSSMNGGMNDTMMQSATPMAFSTSSSGWSDLRVGALINGFADPHQSLHFNVSVGLPTGDADKRDNTPMGDNALLGYPMQIGADTYSGSIGATYKRTYGDIKYGTQATYSGAFEDNDYDYRPGNQVQWQQWVSYDLMHEWSLSARLVYTNKGNYKGADPRMNPMMMPTADSNQRGVVQWDLYVGTNYQFEHGMLKGHRLAAEIGKPINQSFQGMQLETDWVATFGWQKAF